MKSKLTENGSAPSDNKTIIVEYNMYYWGVGKTKMNNLAQALDAAVEKMPHFKRDGKLKTWRLMSHAERIDFCYTLAGNFSGDLEFLTILKRLSGHHAGTIIRTAMINQGIFHLYKWE